LSIYLIVLYFHILESADDDAQASGLSRKDIFLVLKGHLNENAMTAYQEIEKFLSRKLQRSFTLSDNVKSVIRKLLHDLNAKWQQVTRNEDKFLKKFSRWLSVFVPSKKPNKLQRIPAKWIDLLQDLQNLVTGQNEGRLKICVHRQVLKNCHKPLK